MANSFLKSLPSHKKRRKLRHREQRRSDSQSEHHSQKSVEHTDVNRTNDLATQNTNVRLEINEDIEENNEDESLLSDTESCVPGTQFQYPIATLKTNKPSQDEETIGMYSPLSGKAPILAGSKNVLDSVEKREKEEGADNLGAVVVGVTKNNELSIDLPASNGKKPSADRVGELEKNHHSISFKTDHVDVRLGTNQQSKQASVSTRTNKSILERPDSNSHLGGDGRIGDTNLSSGQDISGFTNAITATHQVSSQTVTSRCKAIKAPGVKAEWVLASTDVQTCIDEIQTASNASEQDYFSDVDLASFRTTLEKFKSYLVSLIRPTSKNYAELKGQPRSEWVFTIFERGIDVSHCNVCFICDMIEHIACGIEDLEGDATKLREFAECMEQAFGFNHHFDQAEAEGVDVFASISRTDEGVSKVVFKREASNLKQVATEPSREQISNALPPHLDEISKIFEQYSLHQVQPLQSQLDSTSSTLAKTREGAIQLQRTALDLQNQLQHARIDTEEAETRQSELEAALQKQKYEFEKRLESAERVKDHYKRLLEEKDKELTEAKGTIRQQTVMPDTVHSTTSAVLPSTKTLRNESKIQSKGNGYDSHSLKHPRHGAEDSSHDAKRNRISIEPPERDDRRQRRHHEASDQRSSRKEYENDRNPLGSLTVNSFRHHPTNDTSRRDKNQPTTRDSREAEPNRGQLVNRPNEATATSKMSSSSSSKQVQVTNPYAKKPSQDSNDFDQYVFKYKEVVRGKAARAALPAHECEECRKFNDAIYAQTGADMPGREQMIKECSRHRSRFVPDFTPAGYWDMDFIDEK